MALYGNFAKTIIPALKSTMVVSRGFKKTLRVGQYVNHLTKFKNAAKLRSNRYKDYLQTERADDLYYAKIEKPVCEYQHHGVYKNYCDRNVANERLDDLYYKSTDKASRVYQLTWKEDTRRYEVPKPICKFKRCGLPDE